MDKRPIWVSSEAHRVIKSRAALQGVAMVDYIDSLIGKEVDMPFGELQ